MRHPVPPGQRQPGIGSQSVQQIRFDTALAHRQRNGYGVFANHLASGLAPHPGAHRRDEHFGGGQERQIAIKFTLNDRG